MVEEASSAGAIEGATMAKNWRVWRSGGYISIVTQRVPRGGFGEDSAPPLRCHAGLGPKHSTKGADTSAHGESRVRRPSHAHTSRRNQSAVVSE